MQTWIASKALVVSWAGLDRDGLHLLGSLIAILLVALIIRRPLSSTRPWLVLFMFCIADEIVTAAIDESLGLATIDTSWRDVALVMTIPTILFVVTRYLPPLMALEQRPLRVLLPVIGDNCRSKIDIVDVEFEEVPPPAKRKPEARHSHATAFERAPR